MHATSGNRRTFIALIFYRSKAKQLVNPFEKENGKEWRDVVFGVQLIPNAVMIEGLYIATPPTDFTSTEEFQNEIRKYGFPRAVGFGQIQLVRLMLKHIPNVSNECINLHYRSLDGRFNRMTPVMLAAYCGSVEMIQLLESYGADVHQVSNPIPSYPRGRRVPRMSLDHTNMEAEYGLDAVRAAIIGRKLEVVKYLVEVKKCDANNLLSAKYAIQKDMSGEILDILVKNGQLPDRSLLIKCIEQQNGDCFAKLIENGYDCNKKPNIVLTICEVARNNKNLELETLKGFIVQAISLIENINELDEQGRNAADIVRKSGYSEIIEILRNNGLQRHKKRKTARKVISAIRKF